MYLEGMAESSIFVHVAIIDATWKVSCSKQTQSNFSFNSILKPLVLCKTEQTLKSGASGQKTHPKSSPEAYDGSSEAALSRLLCLVFRRRTCSPLPQGSGCHLSGQQELGNVSSGTRARSQSCHSQRGNE